MSYRIAIVGATGNVGREVLEILAERGFPATEVVPLASRRSLGKEVSFGDKTLKCKTLDDHDFSKSDIAIMSAGGSISQEWAPKIAAAGCVVIDNSSAWRYDPDVPLIVPEVNADAVENFRKKNSGMRIDTSEHTTVTFYKRASNFDLKGAEKITTNIFERGSLRNTIKSQGQGVQLWSRIGGVWECDHLKRFK